MPLIAPKQFGIAPLIAPKQNIAAKQRSEFTPASLNWRATIVRGIGHSIMAGGNASNIGVNDFFPLTTTSLETAYPSRYAATRIGFSGEYVAQWFAAAATTVDAYFRPDTLNIHVMLDVVNSIGHYMDAMGQDAATAGANALADHLQWFADRKAVGWFNIAMTCYAWYGWDAGHLAALAIVNNGLIAAAGGAVVDQVVRLDNAVEFNPSGPAPTTWVNDGIHPTNAGHAVIAALLQPAIEAIYNAHSTDTVGSPLALWLRADLGVSPPGGPVATWADQSGNARDAVQATGAAQPTMGTAINGQATVHFDGSQFLTNAIPLDLPAAHVFAVVKNAVDPPGRLWRFGAGVGDDHHPYNDGAIYDSFGSTERKALGATPHNGPLFSAAGGVVYEAVSAVTEWTNKISGIVDGTSGMGTNVVAWDAGGWMIGATSAGGIVPSAYQVGDWAELIVIGRKLTASESANMAAYIFDQHGI